MSTFHFTFSPARSGGGSRSAALNRRPQGARRPATLSLELQSGYKFALATGLGAGSVWAGIAKPVTLVLLLLAVVVATRALDVLTADPSEARVIRPRDHAAWDGALASTLGFAAVALLLVGAFPGAAIAAVAAVALALLRLRTRYVTH